MVNLIAPYPSEAHYRIRSVEFLSKKRIGACVSIECDVDKDGVTSKCVFVLLPLLDGQFVPHSVTWSKNSFPQFQTDDFEQRLLEKIAPILRPINMSPGEQVEGHGAGLVVNSGTIPSQLTSTSFRPDIQNVPPPRWSELWIRIRNRFEYDPYFKIQGFPIGNYIRTALTRLERIFPADWVKKKYREAGAGEMNADIAHNNPFWFPSYLFAQTATGMICVNPGWNLLIDMALSLDEMKDIPGLKAVERKLTKNNGLWHQLCLAGYFHNRGLLAKLEPETGNGSATNDLMVAFGGKFYDIEVKAFSSLSPTKKLQNELEEKDLKTPAIPLRPIIFYVMLVDKGPMDAARHSEFMKSILELMEQMPRSISGIVIGRAFIDSGGGRVKRDLEEYLPNLNATHEVDKGLVSDLFQPNYSTLLYPLFGIETFMSHSSPE